MITTNAHEISLERGRLWVVLARDGLQNQMAAAQTSRVTEMTRKASLNAMTNASRLTSDSITAYDC